METYQLSEAITSLAEVSAGSSYQYNISVLESASVSQKWLIYTNAWRLLFTSRVEMKTKNVSPGKVHVL